MLLAGGTNLGGSIFGTAPLNLNQVLVCWAFGAGSLIVNIIAKKIPIDHFKFTNNFTLENEHPNDFVSSLVDKTQTAFDKGMTQIKEENEAQ